MYVLTDTNEIVTYEAKIQSGNKGD